MDIQTPPHTRGISCNRTLNLRAIQVIGMDMARQIERYADIYTSRVSNLLLHTPFVYLRSNRGSLPHDVDPHRQEPG